MGRYLKGEREVRQGGGYWSVGDARGMAVFIGIGFVR